MPATDISCLKSLFFISLTMSLFLCASVVSAQEGPSEKHVAAMKSSIFDREMERNWLANDAARRQRRCDGRRKYPPKLDGLVLMVEGVGKRTDPETGKEMIVHNALGLMSYDPHGGGYKMQSHLSNGRSTTADAKFNDDGSFVWWFKTPQGTIRYTIKLNSADQWHEIGEFSADGENWRQFLR
ncbi:MAG: hypothetical protein H6629_07505 [Calditrichae bacterium]|nr:hypothetical protein [Calditrichia bacterium]